MRLRLAAAAALMAALAACTVGPDYRRPEAAAPPAFKELAGWKPAEPREAASGSAWWSIYDDPVLDGLERQVQVSNQTLKASEAAFRAAVAVVDQGRAGYSPVVGASGSGARSGQATGARGAGGVQNSFAANATASWVPDLWGRIHRTVESETANAQASAADLAAATLSAQAVLAVDYFALRVDDELKRVLDRSAAGFQQSLDIARNQYAAGVVAQTDVITAQTQLLNTQAQAIAVGVQRAQFEHAISVLTGKPPAELTVAPIALKTDVPVVPAGLPSDLLERRPDIAAAERAMAAANAQIGVATAAYFPNLTLTGTAGFASNQVGSLFALSNSAWSLGAGLAGTLFNGGLFGAQVAQSRALYDQSVATYRQTVLAGIQQVEDQLAALRILEQEAEVQARALQAAREAVRLTLNQYQAGTVAYTAVVVAQTTALGDEQTTLTILENRLTASVDLIEAVGGGWDRAQLPAITEGG